MSAIHRVLVTGANGFVGRAQCSALAGAGYLLRGAVRDDCLLPASVAEKAIVGDVAADPDWRTAFGPQEHRFGATGCAGTNDERAARDDDRACNAPILVRLAIAIGVG